MQTNSPHPVSDKKNYFSNFVFHSLNSKHKKVLKSESFAESLGIKRKNCKKNSFTQTNFKSKTTVTLSPKRIEIYRESCTQTSKTIMGMVPRELEMRLSPDSLSPKRSPKIVKNAKEKTYVPESTIVVNELGSLSFSRKSDLIHYLETREDVQKEALLSGNLLTKAFLEKKRKRNDVNRYNSNWKKQSAKQRNTLKSQSCIETLRGKERFFSKEERSKPLPRPRFGVKIVKETVSVEDGSNPARQYCRSKDSESSCTPVRGRRASFMSPTFASEQRDQSIELKELEKLIYPTKRGRSLSPKKPVQCEIDETQKDVPYFDRSDHSLHSYGESKHKATGMTDDDIHLNLPLSIDDLTNTTESIRTSSSTEYVLCQAIVKLRDPNWGTSLRGLAEIVEICRVGDNNNIYPHMTTINQRLIELIKCARSHVSRTACQAVGPLFEYIKDTRRPEFDELVNTLLSKTADANKFIRHDANLALDCMVTHVSTYHAIRALCSKGPEHKNPLVRTATARLVVCAIMIAGPEHILHPHSSEFSRKRIILNMVRFTDDKCFETRKFGQKIYKLLQKEKSFDIYMKRYLERDVIVKLKKCLNSP